MDITPSELERVNRDLLLVLVTVIETRDPYTAGHSLAVAQLARQVATWLELPSAEIARIHTAALLHDIGKHAAVFGALVAKPGPLTPMEQDIMQTHATKGARFLERLSTLDRSIIRAVQHHHERYDGAGYPAGLTGEDIPLASRIIGLCDAIHAMASDRPYRTARTPEWIRWELVRCAGSQFDPAVVAVVLRHLDEVIPQ
jgi:putative nucleotidyltransferase with HDIG domain